MPGTNHSNSSLSTRMITIKVLWDVPLYAEHAEVHANRIDAQVIDKEQKEVMSCPWMENHEVIRAKKKTKKYGPTIDTPKMWLSRLKVWWEREARWY